ncbi:TlpA disulfide reductase family protein [Pedobacter sp. SG908]|uniref:TlpA family protein disulfide reductase n=1 Tax=Pedobacter sp. SG908 TaxID=2587135 RepID=UPI00142399C8|nr:TlpA disulfide reductase family protein [Pedobacter sp. SG908]NII83144.1 thiol-disulfide isomerase/thioredoxin [Pedobacter sp. SG908]
MNKNLKFNLIYLLTLLPLLLSVKNSFGKIIDSGRIKAGIVKVSGKITSPGTTNKNDIVVSITVLHPITGENVQYKSPVNTLGHYSIDVEVETDVSMIAFSTNVNSEKMLLFKLKHDSEANIDVSYTRDNDIEKIAVKPEMMSNDVLRGFDDINKMESYRSGRPIEPLYSKSTDHFFNFVNTILSERLSIVKNDSLISQELKNLISYDYRLYIYTTYVFDYNQFMTLNYKNFNRDTTNKPDIQKIDRTYFRFLKDFNLNDQKYLQCFNFPDFQLGLLQNEILNLPMIEDQDIPSWQKKIKSILAGLVGFDKGNYYDILTANAYARQLNEMVKPLTDKQKENISRYWKNGEIAKILFRKNQKVTEQNNGKTPAVINDISAVPDDKVMETILSKYKNKVVFIDLWATWCVPCLEAMKQFRTTKNSYHGKDVVFVYLTNGSSPRKLWEEKIVGIGDEQYYLKASQWNYIMEHFGFGAIPSYLLYNKEGKLINKFTAFPGANEVGEMIKGLL